MEQKQQKKIPAKYSKQTQKRTNPKRLALLKCNSLINLRFLNTVNKDNYWKYRHLSGQTLLIKSIFACKPILMNVDGKMENLLIQNLHGTTKTKSRHKLDV